MKSRLLATDPDPEMLRMYQMYFSNFGFKVATASDGLECVRWLRTFVPDRLILSLDLCWGGADGVLAIVREESQLRPFPVILTAAELNHPRSVEFLSPPVVSLFEKPIILYELLEIIAAALCSRADRQIAPATGVPDS
ncbi:MAG TPA: response regulator [Planctomycetaceae bacterium]|jgi:DNA-binding NtrC family response regulator